MFGPVQANTLWHMYDEQPYQKLTQQHLQKAHEYL